MHQPAFILDGCNVLINKPFNIFVLKTLSKKVVFRGTLTTKAARPKILNLTLETYA
jgi:hypothetical protein